MPQYEVRLENIFTAVSPEDAVLQMAWWASDSPLSYGYRVNELDDNDHIVNTWFIDAEDIDQDKVMEQIDGQGGL